MDKTVLVAIDGSVYSSNSLDYLIMMFSKDPHLNIHLLSIVTVGSSGESWMYDVDPLRSQSPETDKRTRIATRYLKDAKERLIRNGFPEERISYTPLTSAASTTTAIHHEANRGTYDSLLIGRRGVGMVGEMFFGSSSAELITKCHELPLWIIDGEVRSNRFLLAVQNIPASLLAADHLAYMLKDQPSAEVCLYHSNSIFGDKSSAPVEDFHGQWTKAWCDEYLDLDNFLFYAHAQVLKEGGIAKNNITQLPVQMHIDVGYDLLRQANKNHCGTIVIGRRGRYATRGLFKSVSDRTMQQAHDIAVWLVG